MADRFLRRHFEGTGEILKMALPIIAAVASVTVMQVVDFLMVSKVGQAQTAAVTPAGMLVFVVISFLIGVLSCNSTFVSQSHARGNLEDCTRYTWQSIYISAIIGGASLLLWPLAPGLFRLIGHEPQLQVYEVAFFQISLFTVATAGATAGLGSFFQAIGRPMILLWVALEANILNIGLNYVLIFGKFGLPAMGMQGSALGTVIALAVQVAILMIIFLNGPISREHRSRHTWQWDWVRMKALFRIGWAAGLQFALDISCWGVFTALVVGRIGETALAASNIALQIMRMSFMPTIGLGLATTVVVGQKIGKGAIKEARALVKTAINMGMVYMFVLGVLFLIFRYPLVQFFRQEPGVVERGAQVLILAATFQLFDALGIVCSGALKGAGDTRFPAVIQILYAWVVFIPASWLLAYKWDLGMLLPASWVAGYGLDMKLIGAWTAACIFIVTFGITVLFRWRSAAWESIDIFAKSPTIDQEIAGAIVMVEPREEVVDVGPRQKPDEEEDPGTTQ